MARPDSHPLPYADDHARVLPELPGASLAWLKDMRADSMARIADAGLPSTRSESWKYTNLRSLTKLSATPTTRAAEVAVADLTVLEGAHRLVFVDGGYRPDLSDPGTLPKGATLTNFAGALAADPGQVEGRIGALAAANGHAVVNLNTAFMSDGLVLMLDKDVVVDEPIHLVFAGSGARGGVELAANHMRNLILAGPGSHVSVVESHVAASDDAAYWTNPVTEIDVGEAAWLRHIKLQSDAAAATHLAFTRVQVARDGGYENFALSLGASLSRNEIEVVLNGTGASCRLDGAFLMRDKQHCDTTTLIEHAAPGCTSNEVYKGVLDGRARGVFQGKIVVAKDAQQTNGHQQCKSILLSDRAEIDTKPELEIYADDVLSAATAPPPATWTMTRSSTCAARGMPGGARPASMLIEAFLDELLEAINAIACRGPLPGSFMTSGRSTWLADQRRTREAA